MVRHAGNAGLPEQLNTKDFSIEVSADGKRWTCVDRQTDNEDAVTDVDLTPVKCRYVRLSVRHAGADGTARIGDIEVYGQE